MHAMPCDEQRAFLQLRLLLDPNPGMIRSRSDFGLMPC